MSLQIYNDVAFEKANLSLTFFVDLLVGEYKNILPPEIIIMIKEFIYFDRTHLLKKLCLLNKKNNSIFNYKIIRRDKIESYFIYGGLISRIRRTTQNPPHRSIPRFTTEMKINVIPHVKRIGDKFYFCHPEAELS